MAQTGKRRARPRPRLGLMERMVRGAVSRACCACSGGSACAWRFSACSCSRSARPGTSARSPTSTTLLDPREGGSVTLVDAAGETFAWRGQQLGVTRAEDVSPHLINAIIATEDRRFYWHFGVDLQGTARALVVNLRAGETVQGGSSITQQVAKLVFFDNTRTPRAQDQGDPGGAGARVEVLQERDPVDLPQPRLPRRRRHRLRGGVRALLRQVGGRGEPGRGGDARRASCARRRASRRPTTSPARRPAPGRSSG